MKKLPALLLSVCVSTFVYAQDPSSKESGAASKRPLTFELPKKMEPLYIVNDSTVITAEEFKAINPVHIQSIEVRRYANNTIAAHPDAERRGVILIYLKGHRSFSSQHRGLASEKPVTFELPKKTEPLYIVNDSNVITADQFKAINPMHIQSIEVRHYDNSIVAAQNDVAQRGVVLIYLKDRMSFSEEFSQHKKNTIKN
ncbi:MAG TPA: hypothetical protein VIU12_03860 [Chryseolinea sp.]